MTAYAADVIIVGAGIGGLACARLLWQSGVSVLVLEADTVIGGRLRTDRQDGYRFDRGFQVLQLAYPAARELLDYERLELKRYPPGARIWATGRMHLLADPRRRPDLLWQTATAGIGGLADRLRLVRLAFALRGKAIEALFEEGNELLARDFLERYGFSGSMIERFFVPFLTGVCLDPEIRVTDRFLQFVLKMFVEGDVAVPALGMGEIPHQLAEGLEAAAIRCDSRVESLAGTTVKLASNEQLRARAVVIATAAPAADLLLGRSRTVPSCREACLYYATDQPPVSEPFLTLNGSGQGLVNSVNFPSMVAPACAPAGQYLISAVVPAHPVWQEDELEQAVRRELQQWFGPTVAAWQYLRRYLIDHALTRPQPPAANPYRLDPHLGDGIFDCSESRTLPAIQWALLAGRRTAEAVRQFLARR